jgi:oxygen-independent coproporphyrinogen-3 oxidase
MSGIYIHIPFCAEKCAYCNFFSSTDLLYKEDFVHALCKEMNLRNDYLNGLPADTLYIGGGTPTILQPSVIERIISHAKKIFGLKIDAEITLEANPNNLNEEYFKQLTDTSINRLSIGIQSFFDENLEVLGRIHTGKQAHNAIELAHKYCFSNISVDLMYAYPYLTENQWKENLEKVKTLNHLSCYNLTLEENSKLYKKIQNKIYPTVNEDDMIKQYKILTNFAKNNNFIHYETSNFCKSGQFSKHNTAYWQDKNYIGLGPSAHSFNYLHRRWNKSDIQNYIKEINNIFSPEEWEQKGKNTVFEQEILTPFMRVNEYIMTSLRTIWGCDMQYIKKQFGVFFHAELLKKLKIIDENFYKRTDNKLILSKKGSLFADAIASELFLV